MGNEFTQPQNVINQTHFMIGNRTNSLNQLVFCDFDLPNMICDHNSYTIQTNKMEPYFLILLWKTQFMKSQFEAFTEMTHSGVSLKNIESLIILNPDIYENSELKDIFYENLISSIRHLYYISKILLKIGTTLLEQLIEAETDEERNRIETLLSDIVHSINSDIFISDLTKLPDYYENYTSQEEFERLIKNLPVDLQYETFEDYKSAGKYIDNNKLEQLKNTVESYAKIVIKEENHIEDESKKLIGLIARILNDSASHLPGIIKLLKEQYPEAMKQYEIGLEQTVENALRRHNELFEYQKNFNLWSLIDNKLKEKINLQKDGMKQFLQYKKDLQESSEATLPEQKLLVYAMVAFIDENKLEEAKSVARLINEKTLEEDEKKIYFDNIWRVK